MKSNAKKWGRRAVSRKGRNPPTHEKEMIAIAALAFVALVPQARTDILLEEAVGLLRDIRGELRDLTRWSQAFEPPDENEQLIFLSQRGGLFEDDSLSF